MIHAESVSKRVAVRLNDELLAQVDRERRRSRTSRTDAIQQGLTLWMEQRQLAEAMRRDREGYARLPVREDEFDAVLGAQAWPR
jgi:Arc/MetJ-type ribon-helix-helix transcriptional regulator